MSKKLPFFNKNFKWQKKLKSFLISYPCTRPLQFLSPTLSVLSSFLRVWIVIEILHIIVTFAHSHVSHIFIVRHLGFKSSEISSVPAQKPLNMGQTSLQMTKRNRTETNSLSYINMSETSRRRVKPRRNDHSNAQTI